MKLTIVATLMTSILISMGEAVHVKNKVRTHTHLKVKVRSPVEEIESKKVDCETDADCASHGGSCALTRLEWRNAGAELAEAEKSNSLITCAATAMCGTNSSELNDGIQKTRFWYCGKEKAEEEKNSEAHLGLILGTLAFLGIGIGGICYS